VLKAKLIHLFPDDLYYLDTKKLHQLHWLEQEGCYFVDSTSLKVFRLRQQFPTLAQDQYVQEEYNML
jgi:hypothetical protein